MAYIGQSTTEGTRRVYTYVATASQTTFNAVYGVGAVDVYQNGVLLHPSDYTATTGTTVVLGTGAAADDEITIICHSTFSVADTVSSSAGGTFNNDITVSGDLTVSSGTTEHMRIDSNGTLITKGAAVFNEDGADKDFRVESNATSHMLFLDSSEDTVHFNRSAFIETDSGVSIRNDGLIQGTRSSGDALSLRRTTSAGQIIALRYGTGTGVVGGVNIDSGGATYNTEGSASHEYNHLDKDSHVLQRGIIPSSGDWNSNTYRNSVVLTQNQGGSSNGPNTTNNGLGFYISSQGMGSTYDDAASERAFQLYFPDGDESGIHYRVKQGNSGWHRWKMAGHDVAYKWGPAAFNAVYKNTYHYGHDYGTSFDATSNTSRITIQEDGYYWCMAHQRSTGSDTYIGLAIDGSRTAMDSRSTSWWSHDHASTGGSFTHSMYMGPLTAGEHVTCGASTSGNANSLTYTTAGYAGGFSIVRIS